MGWLFNNGLSFACRRELFYQLAIRRFAVMPR